MLEGRRKPTQSQRGSRSFYGILREPRIAVIQILGRCPYWQ